MGTMDTNGNRVTTTVHIGGDDPMQVNLTPMIKSEPDLRVNSQLQKHPVKVI